MIKEEERTQSLVTQDEEETQLLIATASQLQQKAFKRTVVFSVLVAFLAGVLVWLVLREMQRTNNKINTTNETVRTAQKELEESVNRDLILTRESLSEPQRRLESIQNELAQTKQQVASLRDVRILTEIVSNQQTTSTSAKAVEALVKKVNELESKASDREARASMELQSLKGDLAEIGAYTRKVDDLQNNVKELRNSLRDVADIKSQMRDMNKLPDEFEHISKDIDDLKNKIKSIEDRIAVLEKIVRR